MPARSFGRTFVPSLYAESPFKCIERPRDSKVFPVKCASTAFSNRKHGICDAKVRHLRCESTAFTMQVSTSAFEMDVSQLSNDVGQLTSVLSSSQCFWVKTKRGRAYLTRPHNIDFVELIRCPEPSWPWQPS